MQTVIIVVHLMIVAVLIGTVLLQKSEGGGLGMGGGAGFMSSRGTANLLVADDRNPGGAFLRDQHDAGLDGRRRSHADLDPRHFAGNAVAAGRRDAGRSADLWRRSGHAEEGR